MSYKSLKRKVKKAARSTMRVAANPYGAQAQWLSGITGGGKKDEDKIQQTSNWTPEQNALARQMIGGYDLAGYQPVRAAQQANIMDFMNAKPDMKFYEEAVGAPGRYAFEQGRTALEQRMGPNFWQSASNKQIGDYTQQYNIADNSQRALWAKEAEQRANQNRQWAVTAGIAADPRRSAEALLANQNSLNTIIPPPVTPGLLDWMLPQNWFA